MKGQLLLVSGWCHTA